MLAFLPAAPPGAVLVRRLAARRPCTVMSSGLAGALLQPQFEALNAASSVALRTGVWLDFRLAVLFFVSTPLVLLAASAFAADDGPRRIMFGYWQARVLSGLLLCSNLL
jgi:hypothetical protein